MTSSRVFVMGVGGKRHSFSDWKKVTRKEQFCQFGHVHLMKWIHGKFCNPNKLNRLGLWHGWLLLSVVVGFLLKWSLNLLSQNVLFGNMMCRPRFGFPHGFLCRKHSGPDDIRCLGGCYFLLSFNPIDIRIIWRPSGCTFSTLNSVECCHAPYS